MTRHAAARIFWVGMLVWVAVGAGKIDPAEQRDLKLLMEGTSLKEKQAAALEEKISAQPDDIDDRIRLLGYYNQHHRRTEEVPPKAKHILWLINNDPDQAVLALNFGRFDKMSEQALYVEGKIAWEKQIKAHPDDAKAMRNMAAYLVAEGGQSEAFLKKGESLDATDLYWPEQLGRFYQRKMSILRDKDEHAACAATAQAEFEKALKLAPDQSVEQWSLWEPLAVVALEAGDEAMAKRYADDVLAKATKFKSKWNFGDVMHHVHLVLGRVALHKGNVEEAKKQLALAGDAPSTSMLRSFGPNMMLAKELLEKGETDVVLKYFARVGKFWNPPNGKLQAWTETVKKGEIPDFGANLVF